MTPTQAKDYFCHLHDVGCNQKYNKTLPYSFHLEMVAKQASKFAGHIPADNPRHNAIWAAAWGHDSIEDARLTYNDIKDKFDKETAEIIYLCTEDKGRNRAERKSHLWYQQLKTNEDAVFVKLCDIIANVKFSLLTNSSMLMKYKVEYGQKVRPHLYSEQYKNMFEYLDRLFQVE